MGPYSHVVAEELLAVGDGEGDRIGDVGAGAIRAEMAVAHSRVAGRIDICFRQGRHGQQDVCSDAS